MEKIEKGLQVLQKDLGLASSSFALKASYGCHSPSHTVLEPLICFLFRLGVFVVMS